MTFKIERSFRMYTLASRLQNIFHSHEQAQFRDKLTDEKSLHTPSDNARILLSYTRW